MSDRATITGERVNTPESGFNPTWQRHVAAYGLCAPLLPADGPVLDLGCGVGHSYELLARRDTVGVDLAAEALEAQARETHVADMRDLPFGPGRFRSVLSVHSIEHVPDPEAVLAEIVRILPPDGTAIFVTPNRLTFGVPDEIIDPYHYIEFDPAQFEALCGPFFGEVEIRGIAGSARYDEIVAEEKVRLHQVLGRDFLKLRRLVPRRGRQILYDRMLTRERKAPDPRAAAITAQDFSLTETDVDSALDLVAVCLRPQSG